MDNGSIIENYKNQLVEITNHCGLTIGTAYYVAKDFLRELEKTYIQSLQEEKKPEIKEGVIGSEEPIEGEEIKEVAIC